MVLERRDSVNAVDGRHINKIAHHVLSLRKAKDGFGKKRLRGRRGWMKYQQNSYHV